jgi:hypothetical protein
MSTEWRPKAGQVALIEVAGDDVTAEPMTGIVVANGGGITIDLGASPHLPTAPCDVTASFFTPEALYLVQATAEERSGGAVIQLSVVDVLAVQRRSTPRRRAALPVTVRTGDGAVAVEGETIDIARGGCRIRTGAPINLVDEPMLSIELEDGEAVTAPARILEVHPERDQWEYRLAFEGLDATTADRLALASL